MKLGAYTITVDVADAGGSKALPEYDVEMKGNEISCWIASEEGKVSSTSGLDPILPTDSSRYLSSLLHYASVLTDVQDRHQTRQRLDPLRHFCASLS